MEIEKVLVKTENFDDDFCTIVENEKETGDCMDIESINEMPFKCGICGHRTTTDTLLKVHMKMHLVKRIHQCNICKRTFSFVTELNSHILTHSDGKISSHCEICDKDFFTEEDLHKHYRIHTKEKPFRCKSCFRAFSNVSYLRVHERSHHGGEDYLKKKMLKDGTFVDPSVVKNLNEEEKPKVSDEIELAPKTFKNDFNAPLKTEEKLMLLNYIEELGLNQQYSDLERIRSCLKYGWTRIVQLFAENGYNRSQEKLQRTYFHLKNQAKTHIERYYKHKKLPKPHAIDYLFVKLCPVEFAFLDIDMEQVIKDSQHTGVDRHLDVTEKNIEAKEVSRRLEEDSIQVKEENVRDKSFEIEGKSIQIKEEYIPLKEEITDNGCEPGQNRFDVMPELYSILEPFPSSSQKRSLPGENSSGNPNKMFKRQIGKEGNNDDENRWYLKH